MFQDGFPESLKDDVFRVGSMIPLKTYSDVSIGTTEHTIQYSLDGHIIRFPDRIYYISVPDEVISELSLQQKMILNCIYSRSCDGYVRQKHLRSLLSMDYADWAIPYIVKLCDEYVIEILEMTYEILNKQDTEQIKMFCLENVKVMRKSYERMISYWNEYYRYRYSVFNEYVGKKLFKECLGYPIDTKKIGKRKKAF